MNADWLFAQLSPHAPGLWLLLSFISAAFYVAFPHEWVGKLWRWRIQIALTLLIPYCGLIFGGLSPRLMGISGVDWQATLSLGLGLCFVLLVLLILVRATLDLAAPVRPPSEPVEALQVLAAGWQLPVLTCLYSGITEFHWTFLRGAFWELIVTLPTPPNLPAYWAIWMAAALAAIATSYQRKDFLHQLTTLATLAMTSILFFYTRNFWLCWLLHSAARLILMTELEHSRRDPSIPIVTIKRSSLEKDR